MSERRKAYVEKLKAQLDKWNADIDKYEARTKEAEASLKIKYEDELMKLHQQRNDIKTRLSALQEASEEAWDDVVDGLEKSWDIFRESMEKAMSRFK